MMDSVLKIKLRTALWLLAAVAAWIAMVWWDRQHYGVLGSLLWALLGGFCTVKTYSGIVQLRHSSATGDKSV
jgi:hypothetical protein